MVNAKAYINDLEALRNQSIEMGIPAIDWEDGLILYTLTSTLAKSSKCPIVFEAGSGIGYSTLWIATALIEISSCGMIIATEHSFERLKILIENFKKIGLDSIIDPRHGDSIDIARDIDYPIDMVFIDIEKHRYIDLFKVIEPKIRNGGLLAAHNIYLPDPDAGKAFIEHISKYYRNTWKIMTAPTKAGMAIGIKLYG